MTDQNRARFAPTPSLPYGKMVGVDPAHKGYEHAGPKKGHHRSLAKFAAPKCTYSIIAYPARRRPAYRREDFSQQLSLPVSTHKYLEPPQVKELRVPKSSRCVVLQIGSAAAQGFR